MALGLLQSARALESYGSCTNMSGKKILSQNSKQPAVAMMAWGMQDWLRNIRWGWEVSVTALYLSPVSILKYPEVSLLLQAESTAYFSGFQL